MKFGQQAPGYTLLPGKIKFPSNDDQKVKFDSKMGNLIHFMTV
jgi:hypothetical protein